MADFYELDSSRVTIAEMWWGTKNPITLSIATLLKVCRVRIPNSSDDPNVDTTLPFVVETLPPQVEDLFRPLTAQLATMGFCEPVFHVIEDQNIQTVIYWATFRHVSGQHCARIHHRTWGKAQNHNRGLFPLFITSFQDGTFLVSSAGKPDVAAPDTVQMNRMPMADAAKLWATHEQLSHACMVRKSIRMVTNNKGVVDATERLHILQRDFHLVRGYFRSRTKAEQIKADIHAAHVEQARADGTAYPEVMAELTQLQEKKPRWSSGILVLAVSIVAYFAAGTARWNWKTTLALVPILLFHEMGHWIAMRIFKYRNLRMFFIPFFGAAVTGRNFNVAGWKKALVSLAGPLPGIALGVVLGVVAMIANLPALKQAALMLLLLNGFNLLPVLPLDGGHFLHATLFCRNRWLDIVFRVMAVIALLSLSLLGMGRFFMYLGIVFAIALPVAFKMAKITDEFRKRSFVPPPPGEDRIPSGIAESLITAVKAELNGKASNAVVAQQTLGIYEVLNARPPGVWATLGLLTLYGAGLLASIGCGAFLVISSKGGVGDFFRAAIRQPTYAASCADTDVWRGKNAAMTDSQPVNLIVSTFKTSTEAQREYRRLTAQTPAESSMLLYGSSLLLKLPTEDNAGREKWFDAMQQKTTNTFVVVSNNSVSISMVFLAPTALVATNIQQELKDYLNSSVAAQLIAPWDAEAEPKAFEIYRKARRTWVEMNAQVTAVWKDERLKEFSTKINAANRRGSTDEVDRLLKQQQVQSKELQESVRQQLAKKYQATPFAPLVDLERRLSETSYTNQTERVEILKKVAQNLGANKQISRGSGFGYGSVTSHGLMLDIPLLAIHDPETNLPLLMNWLCRQNCQHFKYQFANYSFSLDDFGD
ncbi:MAG: hypothetical protein JWM68_5256 [Verrucomicrobiales bacterium]|nr:hypothetical protein [Verrucomicrobiales bacterium]